MNIQFNENSTYLACGYNTGRLGIYPIYKLNSKKDIIFTKISDYPITNLKWKPESQTIITAVTADGYIKQIHSSSGKIIHVIMEKNNNLNSLDYSKDGKKFCTAGDQNTVNLYDDETKTLISKLGTKKLGIAVHSNRICCSKFNTVNDYNMIISGGWDDNLIIYDIRVNQSVASMRGPHVGGESLDFKGNMVLGGSLNRIEQVQLFDIRKMHRIASFDINIYNTKDCNCDSENTSNIYSCKFAKNKNLFAVGGSSANFFRVYGYDNNIDDYNKNNFIVGNGINIECDSKLLEFPCYTVDFSNDDKFVAYGCADSLITIIEIK